MISLLHYFALVNAFDKFQKQTTALSANCKNSL